MTHGKKRALLIGCNYPGTNAKLDGCVNDVNGQAHMLKKYFGFTNDDITIMIDTDSKYTAPTGRNIKALLTKMVAESEDGDILFVHYSGHGIQMERDQGESDEDDGKDEAICPTDMNFICDDDLRIIFEPLSEKKGVKLTFVADCCHSGSMLDHEAVHIEGNKKNDSQVYWRSDPQDMDSSSVVKRELPKSVAAEILSQTLGRVVSQAHLRAEVIKTFGSDASSKIAQLFGGGSQEPNSGSRALGGRTKSRGGGFCSFLGCGGNSDPGVVDPKIPEPKPHGQPPRPHGTLDPDVGILITGCQDTETSADVRPSADPNEAYGAMSNAMQTIVAGYYDGGNDEPLTNESLVLAIRVYLQKQNFKQNPCLECSVPQATSPFIKFE